MDIASGWLDIDRLSPLPVLVEEARARHSLPSFDRLAATPTPSIDALLCAAFDALDVASVEIAGNWNDPWPEPLRGLPALPDPSGVSEALLRRLRRSGFDAIVVTRLGLEADDRLLFIVAPESRGSSEILACAHRAMAGFSRLGSGFVWSPHPTFISTAMWRAAALFKPAPFTGAALVQAPRWLGSVHLPPPPLPPRRIFDALVRGRVVEQFHRARGQLLRSRRPRRLAAARLDGDIENLLPALAVAQDERRIELVRNAAPPKLGERERVRRLRAWIASRREVLAPALAERLASQPRHAAAASAPGRRGAS